MTATKTVIRAKPKKPGPKGRVIDWPTFEKLCGLQCTQEEICNFLDVSHTTLREHARKYYNEHEFSQIYKRFADNGKTSLRRHQFVLSRTNASMAIWLGKQWLGQRDHVVEAQNLVVAELRDGIRKISQQSGSESPKSKELAT